MPEMISIFDFLRDPPPPRLVPVHVPEGLALEVARLLAERFPDHLCFIGAPSVDPPAPSEGAPPARSSPDGPDAELEASPARRPANTPAAFLTAWQRGQSEFPFCPCRGSDLYDGYVVWALDQRARPVSRAHFNAEVDARPGWARGPKHVADAEGGVRRVRMVIPEPGGGGGFAAARRFSDTEGEWLGRCLDLFAGALAEACEE